MCHPINKILVDGKRIKMHELCCSTEGNINRAVKNEDLNLSGTSLTLIFQTHMHTGELSL